LDGRKYDLFIANINRNILLNDLAAYRECMTPGGILLLSGFYEEDVAAIDECCTALGFRMIKKHERNNWTALKYVL
ncbi:MAG: 50S ribosomal protein L11 methyltransferase, partial [Chitinophagaceae bacterium]